MGSVEIIRDEKISKCYFQIPFLCNFITENIKQHLIYKANRNSDQERLNFFFRNVKRYEDEMKYKQKYSKVKVRSFVRAMSEFLAA